MEYLAYIFDDDHHHVRNLIQYLSSAEDFEQALEPYDSPLVRKSGGIFGICEKKYTIRCPLDLTVFSLLERMQKTDLFDYITEYIRTHAGTTKRIVDIVSKAIKLKEDPTKVNSFLERVSTDFVRIARNFVYLYLRNVDVKYVRDTFSVCTNSLKQLEENVVELLEHLRSTAIEEEAKQDRLDKRATKAKYAKM